MIERDHKRRKVLWDAEVCREDGRPMKCYVLDIAVGGAKIRTEAQFPLGSKVELIVPHLAVAFLGKIQWQRGIHAGVGFLDDPRTVLARLDETMRAKLEPIA